MDEMTKKETRFIQMLLASGEAEKANSKIDHLLQEFPTEPVLHQLKVRCLMVSGKTDDALAFLNSIPNPNSEENVANRTELLITLGRLEDAKLLLESQRGISHDNDSNLLARSQVLLYESQGEFGDALKLAETVEARQPGFIGLNWIQRLRGDVVKNSSLKRDLNSLMDEYAFQEEAGPSLELAAKLRCLFQGRQEVHALQTRFKGGSWGYRPIYAPMAVERVLSHLIGHETLGLYLLNRESKTRLMVFDLDIAPAALPDFLNGSTQADLENRLRSVAQEIISEGRRVGLPLYPEKSGYKGIHLWGFFSDWIPAKEVRTVSRALLARHHDTLKISVEVFPKQDLLKENGLGNLVKLPLGIHRVNGSRSRFLDPDSLEPSGPPLHYLKNVHSISQNDFRTIVQRFFHGTACGQTLGKIPDSPLRKPCEPVSYAAKIENVPEAIDHMARKCRLFLQVLSKCRQGLPIERSESHVLAYLLKPLGSEGEEFFQRLMALSQGYDPKCGKFKLKAVPPTLISCSKVRARLAHIGLGFACHCQMNLPWDSYPSPLVHAGLIPKSPGKIHFGMLNGFVAGNENL